MVKNQKNPINIEEFKKRQATASLAVNMATKTKFERKKALYAVKDEAIGFMDVFVQANDAIAVRAFHEAVNNPASPFNKYPDSFTLYRVGFLNEVTGALTNDNKEIMKASNCITKEVKNEN